MWVKLLKSINVQEGEYQIFISIVLMEKIKFLYIEGNENNKNMLGCYFPMTYSCDGGVQLVTFFKGKENVFGKNILDLLKHRCTFYLEKYNLNATNQHNKVLLPWQFHTSTVYTVNS